ncbi:hypothetical protein HDG34_003106 [Paraburkholderia sp. HC6.4b]|uniref:hypothetical protein n=1 Tax=unclassified Paraburkholderia TaxID=2615204 RepID=UPI0016113CAC|nr:MULTISPECIES: hypothetical protein [unclassified Paraburkholderia]MBB5409165.1 hypothetical protein [Paraburkholderia sp. HC6.4b]MBB5450893.1 hypothetical protein [Paraburkholderia sp. Kb1A]
MSLLRVALECDEPVESEETLDDSVPEGDDQVRAGMAETVDEDFEHDAAMDVVAESIHEYYDQLRDLIHGNAVTPALTALIIRGVNQQLASVGLEVMNFPALESYTRASAEEQAGIALEGIATTLKTLLFQDPVLNFKHYKDIILDAFRSIEGKLAKYEGKTRQNRAEFEQKKGKLGNRVEISLHGLWYFFTTGQGQPQNLTAALSTDLAGSGYMLTKYPAEVISAIEKLAAILAGGSAKDRASIDALAKKVETLKSAVELFDSQFMGNGKYFNMTSVVASTTPNQGSRLEQMSRSGFVVEKTSAGHTASKAMSGPLASIIRSRQIVLSVQQLEEVFDAAQAYCDNVKHFLELESKFSAAAAKLGDALRKLSETAQGRDREVIAAGDRIEAYAKLLMRAFQRPALQEAFRSLRGSKYCNYLGLRGIFNG